MSTRLSITRIEALLAILAIAASTILISYALSSPIPAEAAQQKQVYNQWEYKTFSIGPRSSTKLNEEIPELQWEFVGATDGYAIFRRPVKVIR